MDHFLRHFYLGDQQIELETYAINGHSYVKLRDVGQAEDFNVCYDPARNAAIIYTFLQPKGVRK